MDKTTDLIRIGYTMKSAGRTITDGEFAELHNLAWTTNNPVHTDREFMASTQLGERILAGQCILAACAGLVQGHDMIAKASDGKLRRVTVLGLDNIRFRAPVFPNDTLRQESVITEVSPTSNSDRVAVRIKDTVTKRNGEVLVMELERIILAERC